MSIEKIHTKHIELERRADNNKYSISDEESTTKLWVESPVITMEQEDGHQQGQEQENHRINEALTIDSGHLAWRYDGRLNKPRQSKTNKNVKYIRAN